MTGQEVPIWVAIIVSVIGAGMTYLFKMYLPARDKRIQDSQKYRQATESGAFKQILQINETLIVTLIDGIHNVNGFKEAIDSRFQSIEIALRENIHEWEQVNEVIADIDIELHAIKELLKAQNHRGAIDE